MDDIFMDILDMCQQLNDDYLEQLIACIEGLMKNRKEEE